MEKIERQLGEKQTYEKPMLVKHTQLKEVTLASTGGPGGPPGPGH